MFRKDKGAELYKLVLWYFLVSVTLVQARTKRNDIIQSSDGDGTSSVNSAIPTSDLTEEQREALDKLRQQVLPQLEADYMKEDFYLRRWLEAKDWKVEDAEEMLTKNLQWRTQNRISKISTENWTEMANSYPYEIVMDKDGAPHAFLSIKNWDIRRAVNSGRAPRLQRYMFKLLEELANKLHESRAEGRNVSHWSATINADGFGLFQHACPSCVPVWLNFVKSASERYPGYADSISLVNVPRPLVRILRPIFSSESLKMYGSDKDSWKTNLDEKIDKELRWPEFGGTKTK